MKTLIKIYLCLLFMAGFGINLQAQESIEENIKNARAAFANIASKDAYTDNLAHVDMNILPIGLSKSINNVKITIAITQAAINAKNGYTEFDVYALAETSKNDSLLFGAKGIKLSYEGDIVGDAKLVLLKDKEIHISGDNVILRLLGSFEKLTGEMNGNLTYLEIDCQGFKSLGLAAEVELSKKLCSPVTNEGKPDTAAKARVIGKFQTQVTRFSSVQSASNWAMVFCNFG
ncbi:MAG: hypothetical protein LBT27_03535 [Prevotellaceae bacterium]|jgi:hypothetical protein|nr:hypothetical protein [Prevotellaceae bacterium]